MNGPPSTGLCSPLGDLDLTPPLIVNQPIGRLYFLTYSSPTEILGIVVSIMSIIWTWGGRRLARRFARRTNTSRVEAANLLRRVISVGVTLNLIGLSTSLLGAQYIVGTLVAKAMQNVVGFGGGIGGVASQTLQPLDVLVVQANTNVLMSHFVSLASLLWLTRMVDLLDPPSLEDDGIVL